MTEGFWKDLAAQSKKGMRARAQAETEANDRAKEVTATSHAAYRAHWPTSDDLREGKEGQSPTTTKAPRMQWDLPRDLKDWAQRIEDLAKAWCVHPGKDALAAAPLSVRGAGIDAAQRIFDFACDGAPAADLVREIRRAIRALPAWKQSMPRADSRDGLLLYFRELWTHYDHSGWNPPHVGKGEQHEPPQDRASTPGKRRCRSPAGVEKDSRRSPPPLSEEAQQVARILCDLAEADARSAKDLARQVKGASPQRIRRGVRNELRPWGLESTGRGYRIPASRRGALMKFIGSSGEQQVNSR